MKKHIFYVPVFLALAGFVLAPAFAQEAPVPHNSPRVPVNREALADHKPAVPASREIQGQATIVDGERLRIGDLDLRLFGVVPPQLSASFGPQARTALDELTTGQTVTCLIRDRDREGRFLATCRNANNADLALELLRRGLAVTARGSVASTELAASYIAAEQAAQAQKAGLWSVAVPTAVAVPEAPKTVPVAVATAAPAAATEQPRPKTIDEKPPLIAAKPDQPPAAAAETVPATAKSKPAVTTQVADDLRSSDDEAPAADEEPSFLARYQLLVTGLVMLATAFGILGAVSIQRMMERRTEIRAIAAALRGELMAARAVCLGRLKTVAETEDKDVSWPRIRSTLYQAYVGRLGWLGAELARRVASIYGQASDYAAYYDGSDDARAATMPKRQALQTLVQHIEEILPDLAVIEHTGGRASRGMGSFRPVTSVEATPERPANPPVTNNRIEAVVTDSVTRIRTAVETWFRRPQAKKPASAAEDPITDYATLIEEEMKRFAFEENSEESGPIAEITKLHKANG